MFGVSFADLTALKKKIGTDHDLACALWNSGNYDARVLATMIADPAKVTSAHLERWLKDVDNYMLAAELARLTARTPLARKKLSRWTGSSQEWPGAAGWDLAARLALEDASLPDSYFEELLATIESGIHAAANRTRHSMNGALIAIGSRNPALREKALAAADRIGTVRVDHGQTGCRTPDARDYILKTAGRKQARRATAVT